jgi:hypothetical protein
MLAPSVRAAREPPGASPEDLAGRRALEPLVVIDWKAAMTRHGRQRRGARTPAEKIQTTAMMTLASARSSTSGKPRMTCQIVE